MGAAVPRWNEILRCGRRVLVGAEAVGAGDGGFERGAEVGGGEAVDQN